MAKTNIITGIKALVYIRLMEMKNNIKLVFTHPARIIGAMLKVVVPIIAITRIPYIINSIEAKMQMLSLNMPTSVIGAGVMFLLCAIFFLNLYKSVIDYYPTQYSSADVNFLFTAPINSRLIYGWSILQQVFNTLLGSLIMALPLLLMFRTFNIVVSDREIIYAFLGVAVFIIATKTLNFFLYSISKRFNIRTLVKTTVLISLAAVIAYFIISLYGSEDILQSAIEVLGGEGFNSIPIIGWTKGLILSPFIGSLNLNNLVFLVIVTALMLLITVYLATDYYEEAIVSTEKLLKIRAAFSKNNMEEAKRLVSEKKTKVRSVQVNSNLRKAYAFLWKAIVINKRNSKAAITVILKYVMMAAFGGMLGYVFRNLDYKEIIIYIIILSRVFKNTNSSFEGLEYELKKNYIFMLPGKVRHKLIAINIIPAIKALARNSVIIFPMFLFLKVDGVELLSFWVILSVANLLSLFTSTVIKIILPSSDNKNKLMIFLGRIIETLLELPAVGMGVLTYFLSSSIGASLLVFSICSLLTVIGIMSLSEALFCRLEINS